MQQPIIISCPHCHVKLKLPAAVAFPGNRVKCPSCGQKIEAPAELPTMPPVQKQTKTAPMFGPRPVGGWLLFFCITLVLVPVFWLGRTVLHVQHSSFLFELPALKTASNVELVGMFVILAYGFIVGCRIYGGNPDGRFLARSYLLIRFFGCIGMEIVVLYILLCGLPYDQISVAVNGAGVMLFGELVYFLVWWFYFKMSKRVASTYGT